MSLASLLIAVVPAAAQSLPMPWSQAAALPCKTFLSVRGTTLFTELQGALVEHFSEVDKSGAFGSDCNIGDYVTKACRAHSASKVGQAVAGLLAAQRAGRPLPHIPMCGA